MLFLLITFSSWCMALQSKTSTFAVNAFILSHKEYRHSLVWNKGSNLQRKNRSDESVDSSNNEDNTAADPVETLEIASEGSIFRAETGKLRSNRPFAQPMPSNLKRKVQARRPQLGHVVPKHARKSAAGGSNNPLLQAQGKAPGLSNPSMLKISAGSAKGRRLDSPQVYLRPMMGKVREAVFSTFTSFGLYDGTQAVRHLDVFSGSGSVGLESLSRGASHCTFVDLSPDCCSCVERNLVFCNFDGSEKATIVCDDALKVLNDPYKCGAAQVGQTFQIVTICPPYEEVVYADLLESVANCPCVGEDTVVLVEYPVELGSLPHVVAQTDGGAMIGVRNRRYGRTVIALYVVNPTGKLVSAESRPEDFVSLR